MHEGKYCSQKGGTFLLSETIRREGVVVVLLSEFIRREKIAVAVSLSEIIWREGDNVAVPQSHEIKIGNVVLCYYFNVTDISGTVIVKFEIYGFVYILNVQWEHFYLNRK